MIHIATYIPFSEEQKLCAGAADLEEFLRLRGERLIKSGHEKRLESDHSVTVRANRWYNHAAQRGGGLVSFVQRFYRKSYPEAMALLLGGEQGAAFPAAAKKAAEPRKPFALLPKNGDMRRVYAYLMRQRHIVSVFKLVQELVGPGKTKGSTQFKELMEKLPPNHKAAWFAGSALNSAEQAMAYASMRHLLVTLIPAGA